MTLSHRPHSRSTPRTLVHCLMIAAVASAATLAGCESAVDHAAADRGSARYSESVLARAILQGTYHGEFTQDPTIAQGVRELPRVDTPGPSGTGENAIVPPDNAQATTRDAAIAPVTPESNQPRAAGNAPLPSIPLTTRPLGSSTTQANDVGLSAATLNAPERVFNLSLQDAIARTVKHALDIKVESFNPGIKEAIVVQQEAVFDPVIFGSSQFQHTDEPPLQSFNTTYGTTLANEVGIRKTLPSGAQAQVSLGSTYYNSRTRITGLSYGHYWEPNLNATISQPLLRGFGTDVTEANLYLARRDRRISLETFRRRVITSVANVEEAYQNLILARTQVDIQEQLLYATEETYKRVSDRILVDANRISVNQALAAVEQRRAELVRGRVNLREASDRLKLLLNDPEINVSDNVLINPSDKPVVEPIVFNTAEAITTALRQRTELQEIRLQLEKADINISVAKNDLLPKLDLTASVQTTGLGGRLDAAFGSAFTPGQYLDFAAGVRLEIPIGNRAGEAELRQRQLESNQLLTQLVQEAQTVVTDVKNQLHELLGSYQEIQARERARITAADELKAIIDKEQISALTPEFLQLKLDAQSLLASNEQSLIQAIVNYNLAIMRLEQAKGTLLEFDRISLDRAPIYRPQDDDNKLRFLGKTYTISK